MATFDIFNDDAFSVSQLSKTIVDIPRVPTKIGDMRLFREYGISTPTMMIERGADSALKLVPTAPRGGVRQPVVLGGRKLIPVAAVHLPQSGSMMADEVYGIRAFGKETEVEAAQARVKQKLAKMKAQLDLTLEYHRLGAIMGQVLDADGSVLWDYYDIFGMTQPTEDFDLDNSATKVKAKIVSVKRKIAAALGGKSFTGVTVLASRSFMDGLTGHVSVEKAFELFQQNLYARTDQSAGDFDWLNFKFIEYDGAYDGTDFIPAGKAYAFPTGVPGMFETAYAPGDYMETVNTEGLPYYAKQERMKFDKGVELESQSNPLHLNSLPEAVVELTA
jgi:hypothetical protein